MNWRVKIKAKGADRVLAPLRHQLIDLFPDQARVLEVGCGTGSLLMGARHKIAYGLGIDLDASMIDYATQQVHKLSCNNIHFTCQDARHFQHDSQGFHIATATLFLHEVDEHIAIAILDEMLTLAETVVIADYTRASHWLDRCLIDLDERFSGHYQQYRHYRRVGEIEHYAEQVNAVIEDKISSVIDGIAIWTLTRTHSN